MAVTMPLINFDFSQIEVVMAGQLSGDPTLCDLLRNGQDVHRFIGRDVYNKPEDQVTVEERSAVKPGTFGILYGNGAPRLSENTGKSVEWCKNFIDTFYKLFPKIRIWHQYLVEKVERTGELRTCWGSKLKFRKYPAKYEWQFKKGIIESYNPPDIKNWPVQHAGEVILAVFVGQFWRQKAIYKRDKYLLINTVHDSLMMDCRPEYIEECKKDLQEVLDKLPDLIYTTFNVEVRVPITGEVSVGNNWGEL